MGEPFRSLYSVIPAKVRDDRALRPNAKLLYGELSALTQAEGYCWAYNAYLAELFGLSIKTVEALIKQLRDRGHIHVEVERDSETQEVLRRKIWICGPAGNTVPPPLKNEGRSPQNQGDPPLKIEGENNYNLILTSKASPYSPPAGDKPVRKRKQSNGPKAAPDWKPERFKAFWDAYPCGKSKQAAIKAWDNLRPDETLLVTMAKGLQKALVSEDWKRGIGIPYAATWMNQRRWEDEDKPLPGSGSAPAHAVPSGRVMEEEGTYLL